MLTNEIIRCTNRFINNHGITDDDLKQELYLHALEIGKRYNTPSKPALDYQHLSGSLSYWHNRLTSGVVKDAPGTSMLYEFIPSHPGCLSSDEILTTDDELILNDVIKESIDTMLSRLTDREAQIIRYHFYDNLSYVSIAKIFNLTDSRIVQIEHNAFIKLKYSRFGNMVRDLYM
jgi:RNA polymerase sigma factor (sigma-70 family)